MKPLAGAEVSDFGTRFGFEAAGSKNSEPEALAEPPATTPITLLVSPFAFESTSLSFVKTLPVGFVPDVPFDTPPASTAVFVSLLDTGASF